MSLLVDAGGEKDHYIALIKNQQKKQTKLVIQSQFRLRTWNILILQPEV